MRPLDFYRLGRQLADSASTEAEQRSAVGRLYYGLHHEACCRYFRENPLAAALGRGSRHARLIGRFGDLRTHETQRVWRLLRQLSRMRNISDYELAGPLRYGNRECRAVELMDMAVSVAEALLGALEDYSPGDAEDGCRCPVL